MRYFRILSVVLLILWAGLIFGLSSQKAEDSSKTSGGVIAAIAKIFVPDFDSLSEEEQQQLIEPFQFVARKGAHFTAYAVLGLLSFLSVVTYKNLSLCIRTTLSSTFCLLYSISDEIHQLFVPGRSGEVRDVLIDFSGSLLMILISLFAVKFSKSNIIKKYLKDGEKYEKI